jgi:tRNA pseudouridine38-40 synthase
MIIEYDGTGYHGFQLQANVPTIQAEMEKAILKLTQERIRVMSASRTDTGVRAEGQVISFRTQSSLPLPKFIKGLNYYLPQGISVKAAYRAGESFNIRRNAISREYNYYILNSLTRSPIRRGFSYLITSQLDIESMDQACKTLIGKHDFSSFASCTGTGIKNTMRTVYKAGVQKKGELVIFNIEANSFLPHQVRNTIGTLIRVGQGKMTINEFRNIIDAKKPNLAGPMAPAHGLCLTRVNYPNQFEEEIQ